MSAIHTETVKRNGETYRISIYHDDVAGNPTEEMDGEGTIYSLNRRLISFNPSAVHDAIENNPDAVPLSYFEHGQCVWSVAGELPSSCRCQFDSVDMAGVWIPDSTVLDEAKNYSGRTRSLFMRKRARSACETYTQWSNGEVYGYAIEKITECDCDCPNCDGIHREDIESCWGFYGYDDVLAEARATLPDETAELITA